jgi:membrane-bound metal-dependent hydrolase YbcI (DUF457 family)
VPDLATHVAAAWTLGRGASFAVPLRSRAIYLFTAGTALPDFLARAPHLVLDSARLETATRSLHTPLSLLLVCLAASFLFEERRRAGVFAALWGGALFHCLLDFCQEIGPQYGYGWFYPLSDWSPQLGLFPGDETVLYLPYVLVLALCLELAHRLRGSRRAAGER